MNLYITASLLVTLASAAATPPALPPGVFGSCLAFQTALNPATGATPAAKTKAYKDLKANDVTYHCVEALWGAGATDAQKLEFIKKYPNVLMLAASNADVTSLSYMMSPDVYKKVGKDVITKFFKKDTINQCSWLRHDHLNHLMAHKNLAKLITPDCFAVLPYLRDHDKTNHHLKLEHIKNLPSKVFSKREDEINEDWFEGMTEDQLKNFQSYRALEDEQCSDLWVRLDKIKVDRLKAVTPTCFQNWVINHLNHNNLNFKAASKINTHLLKNADASFFPALQAAFDYDSKGRSAWNKADEGVIQEIANNKWSAMHLHHAAVFSKMSVNAECFERMDKNTQGRILAVVDELPDDLFSRFIMPQLDEIEYADDKNKKSCKGKACLKLIRGKKNIAQIMHHIDAFMCSGKKFSDFAGKENRLLGKYMSRTCFKELEVDFDDVDQHLQEVDENMLQYLPTDIVKKLMAGKRWMDSAEAYKEDKQKERVWPGLLGNPKVCARLVKLEHFKKLEKAKLVDAMDGFSSRCLRVFPEFDKLPENYIKAIGDNIYVAFTKADASKIDYSKSTNVQIGNASAEVENIADHYATTLTSDSVKKIDAAVFGLMNEGYFEAMTENAYSGISKAQFENAPAAKLKKVRAAQFSAMQDDVKKSITPEQISEIGFASGPNSAPEREMLGALEAVSGGFNEHQMKAFKARQALTESGAIGAASASLMAFVASLALIFPLL